MKKVMLLGAIISHPDHNLHLHTEYRTKIYQQKNIEVISLPHSLARIEMNAPTVKECAALLLKCDALVTMEDWHSCQLAQKLVAVAREIGIPVLFITSFLQKDDIA